DSYFLFLSNGHPLHRTLHSFPTRRSSDLIFGVIRGLAGCRFMAVGRAPRFRKELSMSRKMPPLQMNKLCILGSWSQCMRKNERGLSMNLGAQPSRLRVTAASRRQHEHRARRLVNSQARTPAIHPPRSSWSQCTATKARGLSVNLPIGVQASAGRLKAGLRTEGTTQTGSWSETGPEPAFW